MLRIASDLLAQLAKREGSMGKDARAEEQQKRSYYRAGEPRRCTVCGRMFTRRQEETCSEACAQKAAAKP